MPPQKKANRKKKGDNLLDWVKKSVALLVHKSLSETIILSSYKLDTVLKEHYGVNLKVDRIGRALSKYAKKRNLKRLSTRIPKYKLTKTEYLNEEKKDSREKDYTNSMS
ncbi:MAG: hypothetical protein GF364_15845 [Candidatus Lokiarchaeota archaeon]|nr:hypothetical protein [Candidatus Lokiarchaeota archaeon]